MRAAIIPALLLSACGQPDGLANGQANAPATAGGSQSDLQSTPEGAALVINGSAGQPAMRLFCNPGEGKLLVNVPAFKPIASEERLSFGQGGTVVALVADTAGDTRRGGVSGEGPVPADLIQLLSGNVSASYGAQVSGPHPTPPAAQVSDFALACGASAQSPANAPDPSPKPAPGGTPVASTSPCLIQDGTAVPANALKGVGTEPFWAVRVEGRCVTYLHPEDQAGTRVWTKFTGTAASGTWTGALDGRPFVMRTTPQPGCSDGMSDRRYPIAVSLTVGGEQRSGCAEPK